MACLTQITTTTARPDRRIRRLYPLLTGTGLAETTWVSPKECSIYLQNHNQHFSLVASVPLLLCAKREKPARNQQHALRLATRPGYGKSTPCISWSINFGYSFPHRDIHSLRFFDRPKPASPFDPLAFPHPGDDLPPAEKHGAMVILIQRTRIRHFGAATAWLLGSDGDTGYRAGAVRVSSPMVSRCRRRGLVTISAS